MRGGGGGNRQGNEKRTVLILKTGRCKELNSLGCTKHNKMGPHELTIKRFYITLKPNFIEPLRATARTCTKKLLQHTNCRIIRITKITFQTSVYIANMYGNMRKK